jgi:uncharacterized protein
METNVSFNSGGATVRAILHEPDHPNGTGIVYLHGWPGNRLGPHRMFVTLGRQLAGLGFCSLRIDFRGRGDSDGETASASIRSMIADTTAAVDFLTARAPLRRVILLGICSGGKVAIGAASGDPRVNGLVLWSAEAMGNLRVRAASTHKSVQALRVYLKKLASIEAWRKILTGRVNTRMVRKAIVTDEAPREAELAHETALLERFKTFRGDVLFIYGGNDPDTKFAAGAYQSFCTKQAIPAEFHEIPEANHSFYSLRWEKEVFDWTERWLTRPAEPATR